MAVPNTKPTGIRPIILTCALGPMGANAILPNGLIYDVEPLYISDRSLYLSYVERHCAIYDEIAVVETTELHVVQYGFAHNDHVSMWRRDRLGNWQLCAGGKFSMRAVQQLVIDDEEVE